MNEVIIKNYKGGCLLDTWNIVLLFIFFIIMYILPFLFMRIFNRKEENKTANIEKKLDKIIELLEQRNKG